jgi:hypothetical protein
VSTDAARALLGSLIDYAGLFPPAELPMRAAVARYASSRSGTDAWMLGRFVLPLARLEDFEHAFDELPASSRAKPWPLAVTSGRNLEVDAMKIVDFNERHGDEGRQDATIDAIEMKVHDLDDIARADDVLAEPAERFFEMAIESDPSEWLAAVAEVGGRAKVRTGGATADLVPSVHDLARFLEVCAAEDVAFKATAGLHHPVRSAYSATADARSPTVVMHGFLNLFLAAVLAYRHRARADALEPVLGEESPDAFVFDGAGVGVKGHRLACEEIASTRRSFALSFGSCSFDEPASDLKALGII